MKLGSSANLNLLPSQAKFQADRMKLQKKLRQYILVAVVVWVSLGVLTLALNVAFNLRLRYEEKKYNQTVAALKSMDQEIALSQLIKYRIKVLGEVLKERFEYSTAFETISNLFSEANLGKFNMNENKKFEIEVLANDQKTLDYIENRVKRINDGEVPEVSAVTMKQAIVTDDSWTVNMEVTLK
jgi:hypothetical protein